MHNLTGKKRREQLTNNELAAHWESLGEIDASKAYEARADLLHAPDSTVSFLAKRLQPAPAIDAKRVDRLIDRLESDEFLERDQATRELEELGELVRPALRQALAGNPPIETRQRLERLLGKLDQPTPKSLRIRRAIEILEGVGTPAAFAVIERLARGNAAALLTTESHAALARRENKSAPLPPNPIARKMIEPLLPAGPISLDLDGDPMPAGALARLGSARWRLTNEPRRILVAPDGTRLAVVNGLSSDEVLDARTGRTVGRGAAGLLNGGVDLSMSLALSRDWRKVAAYEPGQRVGTFELAVFDRTPGKKVTGLWRKAQLTVGLRPRIDESVPP